ncbi:MAG: hypothetical protein V9F01_02705 [Chitinophagaceae bacterium]
MQRTGLLIFLFLPFLGFSQNFIGKKKTQVLKELQGLAKKNDSLTIAINDNDSVITYSIKASKTQPADFVYGFDKNGRCQSEKITANCDSCYNKYLQDVLNVKKYQWKKINENQYISKYAARLMIELPAESKEFTYTILRTNWNKKMYEMLKGN